MVNDYFNIILTKNLNIAKGLFFHLHVMRTLAEFFTLQEIPIKKKAIELYALHKVQSP